jgi:DDE superfamily endonuclease
LIHASERDISRVQAERSHYRDLSTTLDLHRVKFLDESGINIAMTRLYGRAPRGARARDSAPQNYGQNITMLGALSCTGLEAVMTVEGATDSEVFPAYVQDVLCPTLRDADVVVADNLSAHKAAGM